jgi:hypothetical protein
MPDNSQIVKSSTMLWSEVVARANAAEGEPVLNQREPAYEYRGHTFRQPDDLYRPNTP